MSKEKTRNIFTEGPILPGFIADSIQKHQSQTTVGAHSLFLGQVRADILQDKPVSAIVYTAYEEMALEKMSIIREEIFAKYNLACLHVHHSLGVVPAGAVCLFVFTSSRHRKDAMAACDELVERIKSELPIWGKEVFADSSYQWKQNL